MQIWTTELDESATCAKFAQVQKDYWKKQHSMKTTPEHDERMAKTIFAKVYPYYVKKVESKDRTIQELHQVIEWLTGFDEKNCKS